jgi:hypothetical protein
MFALVFALLVVRDEQAKRILIVELKYTTLKELKKFP